MKKPDPKTSNLTRLARVLGLGFGVWGLPVFADLSSHATADWIGLPVMVVVFFLTLVNTSFSAFVGIRMRRMEAIEKRLETKAEELIDARLEIRTGQLNTTLAVLAAELGRVNERLNSGDTDLRSLRTADHEQRIEMLREIGESQREMSEKISKIETSVAVIESRAKGGSK